MGRKYKDRKLRTGRRVRGKIIGKSRYPRLTVHRSNKYIYAQVIDDVKARTIASESDIKMRKGEKKTKTKRALETGLALGNKLKKLKVTQVVFDRGHYKFAGRVSSLAKGVADAGIKV